MVGGEGIEPVEGSVRVGGIERKEDFEGGAGGIQYSLLSRRIICGRWDKSRQRAGRPAGGARPVAPPASAALKRIWPGGIFVPSPRD